MGEYSDTQAWAIEVTVAVAGRRSTFTTAAVMHPSDRTVTVPGYKYLFQWLVAELRKSGIDYRLPSFRIVSMFLIEPSGTRNEAPIRTVTADDLARCDGRG